MPDPQPAPTGASAHEADSALPRCELSEDLRHWRSVKTNSGGRSVSFSPPVPSARGRSCASPSSRDAVTSSRVTSSVRCWASAFFWPCWVVPPAGLFRHLCDLRLDCDGKPFMQALHRFSEVWVFSWFTWRMSKENGRLVRLRGREATKSGHDHLPNF